MCRIGMAAIAGGVGHVLGAAADLLLPTLRPALASPAFVLQLGEPVMILWLLLAGARAKPDAAPAAPA
jgi:hypothetical protein